MKDLALRWSVAARTGAENLVERAKDVRDKPNFGDREAGEIMSQLVIALGLVLAAAAAVALLGPWVATKVKGITSH